MKSNQANGHTRMQLSALLDDELDEWEAKEMFASLKRDAYLHQELETFALIGDALRGEAGLATCLTPRVAAALDREPLILVPRHRAWIRPLAAMAAAVAGIAVVGAVVFLPALNGETESRELAKVENPRGIRLAGAEMQEYLIAHQAHSSGAYLGGNTQQIRTVSLMTGGEGK